MTEKLTPRVGDRVLVGYPSTPTCIGWVRGITLTNNCRVEIDGGGMSYVPIGRLTVVDREPVEWPRYPMWRYGDYSYIENHRITSGIWGVKESVGGSTTVTNEAASAISADDARKIGEAWLKVAEHWDDLTR